VKGWDYWRGGGYLPIRRGFFFDIDGLSRGLEGVRELE
jgi:hypothetical protein